ncbi:hypothetical protein [Longispora urticae]
MRVSDGRTALVDSVVAARHRYAVEAVLGGEDDRLFVVVTRPSLSGPVPGVPGSTAGPLAGPVPDLVAGFASGSVSESTFSLARRWEKDLLIAVEVGAGLPGAGVGARRPGPRSRLIDSRQGTAPAGAVPPPVDSAPPRTGAPGFRTRLGSVALQEFHPGRAATPDPTGVPGAAGVRDWGVPGELVLPADSPGRVAAALATLRAEGRPARLVVDTTGADRRVVGEWAWRIAEGERGVAGLVLDSGEWGAARLAGVLRVLAAAVRERRHG